MGIISKNDLGIKIAQYLIAYDKCSKPMQKLVIDMAGIIADYTSTEDEREMSFDVIDEAIMPRYKC